MADCSPLEGNADFYGRGIRIGVYLQWTSGWIRLLLDPDSAQAVYEANAMFVFAITIATVIASTRNAPPIEMYIMLQLITGFFATSLSVFGARLGLLSPDRFRHAGRRLGTLLGRLVVTPVRTQRSASALQDTSWKKVIHDSSLYFQRNFQRSIWFGLDKLSLLKSPDLSWTSVTWRSSMAAVFAAYNLIFWFDDSASSARPAGGYECEAPDIFFFARLKLDGPIVGLFQTCAVIVAWLICIPTLYLALTVTSILLYAYLLLLHEAFNALRERKSTLADTIRGGLALGNEGPLVLRLVSGIVRRQGVDLLALLEAIEKNPTTRLSDVFKLFIPISTGKVQTPNEEGDQPVDHEGLLGGWRDAGKGPLLICSFWNVCIASNILWFILSIEYTIHWNHISGVSAIDTTGQLIPFIIGCGSTLQVVKKLIFLASVKAHPDWQHVKLKISEENNGDAQLDIVWPGNLAVRQPGPDQEASDRCEASTAEIGTLTGGRDEGRSRSVEIQDRARPQSV